MPISPPPDSFRLSLTESPDGSELLVYAHATGCGIYLLQRIVVCAETGGFSTCRHFCPGGFFDYVIGSAQIEPNVTILKASVPAPSGGYTAYADGHYLRVDRRAITPVESL